MNTIHAVLGFGYYSLIQEKELSPEEVKVVHAALPPGFALTVMPAESGLMHVCFTTSEDSIPPSTLLGPAGFANFRSAQKIGPGEDPQAHEVWRFVRALSAMPDQAPILRKWFDFDRMACWFLATRRA